MAQTVKNHLQCRRPRFDPWVGKLPWRMEWLPAPVFLPGEFHGQRSLAGYGPWGHKESDTTEWLTLSSIRWTFIDFFFIELKHSECPSHTRPLVRCCDIKNNKAWTKPITSREDQKVRTVSLWQDGSRRGLTWSWLGLQLIIVENGWGHGSSSHLLHFSMFEIFHKKLSVPGKQKCSETPESKGWGD